MESKETTVTILQIMPQFPFPAVDGGKVALANVALQFALQGHVVHLVCYRAELHSEYDASLKEKGIHVHAVQYVPSNTLLRIVHSFFSKRSLYMFKHDTLAMQDQVDRILTTTKISVIHSDHTCMAPIALRASKQHHIPWGFRSNNLEWKIWHRYAERFPTWHPARWYIARQATKIQEEEIDLMRMANRVFTITHKDAAQLHEMGIPCVTAQAGVDPEQWVRARAGQTRAAVTGTRVTMASNFHWIHNVDALKWFLDEVWPEIHRREPSATFHVYGVGTPSWLARYTTLGVTNEGFVENLADHYAKADISVAPLFVGSGFRLKIIEALAAGLPVVATPLSAEGIEIGAEHGLVRADTSGTTIDEICRLISAPEIRNRIGSEGQRLVASEYTWRSSVGAMLDSYALLVQSR